MKIINVNVRSQLLTYPRQSRVSMGGSGKNASADKGGKQMRFSKVLLWTAIAAGAMATGAQAKAEDFNGRFEHREARNDYARASALRNDLAADRFRMNEDLRCGRPLAAREVARDIARDQAALNAQYRDIRHDRR
jgi:hypothetical protein